METRNVVLFGQCGVGKSSIINAIIGRSVAETSNDVFGCTGENACYGVTLDTEIKINLWDTIGLDEGTAGRIPAEQAKRGLKLFLQERIEAPEGIDLLLFCIRGASGKKRLPLKRGHWDKYQFVFEEVCKKKLPIALVVTCLESYSHGGEMDAWWSDNEEKISEFGFQFCAHACITALPLEEWGNDEDMGRIEVSKQRLRELLSRSYLAPRNVLLFGDREDRDDFIDMTMASRNRQSNNIKDVPPFTCIPTTFDRHTHVNFWNVNGLDEHDDDTLITEKNLKLLVHGIKQTPGLDLLLFCFCAGRPKSRHARKYNFFHAAICRKKVPLAIVILGPEEDADTWWNRNNGDLRQKGFRFDEHVYIPCNLCKLPSQRDLDVDTRYRLVRLMQEEYTLGSWTIDDDASWVTVHNVRAVIGEPSFPTTTVIICDATRRGNFVDMVSGLQPSPQHSTTSLNLQRVLRFRQVHPQSLSPISSRSSDSLESRFPYHANHGISLLVFFMSVEKPDSETWKTLENFYSVYKGRITPLIVVVHGVAEKRLAEDFWRRAPRYIRRRIGAYLTYYPGHRACPTTPADAQETMADMIQDRCLIDLGEKVGIRREILSFWKKHHP